MQERTNQLVHRLRHTNVESGQRRNGNDNMVHSVPQNLLLRPGQGRHPVRPRPAGLFVVEAEELRLVCVCGEVGWEWGGGFRIVAVKFNSCEWCVLSARAIATVIRSCLSHERSRRPLRR